jgi:DNA mismatch repair protein MutS2
MKTPATKLEYNKIITMLTEKTATIMGKELSEQLTPANTHQEVAERLSETEEAVSVLDSCCDITFGGIRDIRESVKRAALGAILEPRQLLAVLDTLSAARRLKKTLESLPENLNTPILKQLAQNITILKNIETAIDNAITDQATVKDTASPALAKIRREIKQTQNRVKEKLDNIIRSAEYQKYFQESIITIRNERYVIPVKQEYRNHFPGIVHDQSSSGATLFIEPMAILNLNNDLSQMIISEKNEIERILASLSVQIAQTENPILENSDILARLDLVFAKAKLALSMQASKPILSDKGHMNLIAARHPLIDKTKVVPIDIRLGIDFQILLITGPNTGGKTVALKTAGLFALMVKAGLFIPASPDSIMPIIKNIFADIGDEQSIEQSLSTFSSHMTNIVDILSEITAGDLVLIDEIGAGTDPDEGAALAMAIIEHLLNEGVKVIATTHYSELKTFAYTRAGIENASVEFDIKTLSPTYRLLIGIPGGSNAFAISQRLGLKNTIVKRAKDLINKEHADFAETLSSLEEQKRTYAANLVEIETIKNNFETQKKNLETTQIQLTEKKNSVIINAKDEAVAILRKTRREAEDLIKNLKEQFSEKDARQRQQSIDDARQRLKDNLDKLDEFGEHHFENDKYSQLPPANDAIKPGNAVYVAALRQKGEVLAVNEDNLTVQVGILKMNITAADCRLIDKTFVEKEPGRQKHFTGKTDRNDIAKFSKTISRQIDVRGLTTEEARLEIDKHIDGAILSGLGEILIIHGKGTGALRKGIKKYLEEHPKVRENQIAETNEGGYGATVAKIY